MPKKAATAYILFFNEKKSVVAKENPTAKRV